MDQKKDTIIKSSAALFVPPAQLWVGNHALLIEEITHYLQKIFCQHNTCGACTVCLQIAQQQYHAATWLSPEKAYTLEQLEPIFSTIAYALESGAQHFFIIQNADALSLMCANKLLKSIEEPPQGYHFIFLTERKESIIETIRSRCVTIEHSSKIGVIAHEELFSYFIALQKKSPISFARTLGQSKITEYETVALLDALIVYWSEEYKQKLNSKEVHTVEDILSVLKKSYRQLPMPGGSKLFWRNLFLQMQEYL